jgi:hypothetical protein
MNSEKTLNIQALREVLMSARRNTTNKACKKLVSILLGCDIQEINRHIHDLCFYDNAVAWLKDHHYSTSHAEELTKFCDTLNSKNNMEDLRASFKLYPILYVSVIDENKYSFYGYEWRSCRGEYVDVTAQVYEVLCSHYGSMIIPIKNTSNLALGGLNIKTESTKILVVGGLDVTTLIRHLSMAISDSYDYLSYQYMQF